MKKKSLLPCDCNYCSNVRYPFERRKGYGKDGKACAEPLSRNSWITETVFNRSRYDALKWDKKNETYKYLYN